MEFVQLSQTLAVINTEEQNHALNHLISLISHLSKLVSCKCNCHFHINKGISQPLGSYNKVIKMYYKPIPQLRAINFHEKIKQTKTFVSNKCLFNFL